MMENVDVYVSLVELVMIIIMNSNLGDASEAKVYRFREKRLLKGGSKKIVCLTPFQYPDIYDGYFYEDYMIEYTYPSGVEDEKYFISDTEYAVNNMLIWLDEYLEEHNAGASLQSLGFIGW